MYSIINGNPQFLCFDEWIICTIKACAHSKKDVTANSFRWIIIIIIIIIITEIQKICMLGSARILRKVLSVWTEWLTWVTDALGAWFAPGWCTKRTPAKTVIIETIIIITVIMIAIMIIKVNDIRETWRFDSFMSSSKDRKFSSGNRTFNYNVAKKLINCYRR